MSFEVVTAIKIQVVVHGTIYMKAKIGISEFV